MFDVMGWAGRGHSFRFRFSPAVSPAEDSVRNLSLFALAVWILWFSGLASAATDDSQRGWAMEELRYAETCVIVVQCQLARARARLAQAEGDQKSAIKELRKGIDYCARGLKGVKVKDIACDSYLLGVAMQWAAVRGELAQGEGNREAALRALEDALTLQKQYVQRLSGVGCLNFDGWRGYLVTANEARNKLAYLRAQLEEANRDRGRTSESKIKPASVPFAIGNAPPEFSRRPRTIGPENDAVIEGLIQQLGRPKFRDRQEAAETLTALGKYTIAPLRRAMVQSPDLEIRRRSEHISRNLWILMQAVREWERHLAVAEHGLGEARRKFAQTQR